MPFYRISIEYGRDVDYYVKANNQEDAEGYAEDIEHEVYVDVIECDDPGEVELEDDLT